MSLHWRKAAGADVTPRTRGQSEADLPGGVPKRQREKRARNQAAVAGSARPKPKAKVRADDMHRFVRDNPAPRGVAGIEDQAVVQDAIARTAMDFKGRTVTVDQFIGRLWERLLLKAPDVHARLADPLNDAIGMQLAFLQRIHSSATAVDPKTGIVRVGTGFFDAAGNNVHLTGQGRVALGKRTKGLGKFASVDPAALAKKGLVYADRFRIGGKDYVDGAILMPFAGRYIVLLRIEAKTRFSGGVDAQLGAFFRRLASAGLDQKIECYIGGVLKKDLARKRLLFNPMWTDSGVGVQEWGANMDTWADARGYDADATPDRIARPQAPELGERLDRGAKRLEILPADQRPAFADAAPDAGNLERLTALAVSGQVLYAKSDLRQVRAWLLRAAVKP